MSIELPCGQAAVPKANRNTRVRARSVPTAQTATSSVVPRERLRLPHEVDVSDCAFRAPSPA
ncbi:hypothetical protein [Burkholderia oklahomensis]|uniref:Uncharacterized protein n=1 Tax=Burkholderia oklahomensis TaxID=342113 RepID=A0AAI8BD14_9BURK|nr:hypothetical protein [Burkholderia oklahomensis]AIO70001.1 hypothetical protein DM82_5702 [Burkholderia oklahomensis]AOI38934.1 hypothetical protein WG70_04420 [Burkholderia oklahomensis EO147]KUY65637.1 hypothetical protein WG70_27865 [Burkholderia oklahomensis EO147]QPS40721.1 hypothetical protein I6G57_20595 [Burkholderia oklahomensis]